MITRKVLIIGLAVLGAIALLGAGVVYTRGSLEWAQDVQSKAQATVTAATQWERDKAEAGAVIAADRLERAVKTMDAAPAEICQVYEDWQSKVAAHTELSKEAYGNVLIWEERKEAAEAQYLWYRESNTSSHVSNLESAIVHRSKQIDRLRADFQEARDDLMFAKKQAEAALERRELERQAKYDAAVNAAHAEYERILSDLNRPEILKSYPVGSDYRWSKLTTAETERDRSLEGAAKNYSDEYFYVQTLRRNTTILDEHQSKMDAINEQEETGLMPLYAEIADLESALPPARAELAALKRELEYVKAQAEDAGKAAHESEKAWYAVRDAWVSEQAEDIQGLVMNGICQRSESE